MRDLNQNFEYQVCMLGGPRVGKTSFLRKVIENTFVSHKGDSSETDIDDVGERFCAE